MLNSDRFRELALTYGDKLAYAQEMGSKLDEAVFAAVSLVFFELAQLEDGEEREAA